MKANTKICLKSTLTALMLFTVMGFISDLTFTSASLATIAPVDPPPTFSKRFMADPMLVDMPVTLRFEIDNTTSSVNATAVSFTDNLPAGMVINNPANASTTPGCIGGTVTAVPGTTTISYTGGTLSTTTLCAIEVDVVSSTVGDYTNTSGDLTSSLGNSGTATDTLRVDPHPTFSKSFSPDPINIGDTTTLTFLIDNTASTTASTGMSFTDNLPAGLTVATPSNATNNCFGLLTATSGSGTISYDGGGVLAGTNCTMSVDVTASAAGALVNTTSDLTYAFGNCGTATDTLTVNAVPTTKPAFSKRFMADPVPIDLPVTLELKIDNSSCATDATSLDFTDNLPAGLVIANPANASNTCTGGTLTATPGTAVITYSGGTVSAGAACTIEVDVISSTAGDYSNATGDLTSSLGNSGTATDTLRVDAPPDFSKSFSPNTFTAGGVSTLTFLIDNTASTSASTALDFSDNLPAGVVVATPANTANSCGGALTATSGTNSINLAGGGVAPGGTCSISIDVTSGADGTYVNTTDDLTSSMGNSGTATDTLTVNAVATTPPVFSKRFLADPVPVNLFPVGLEFKIDNTANATAATSLNFSDNLPAGLVIANPANASTTCTGGTLTATPETGVITYTGGAVSAGASCVVEVDVIPTATGDYTNTSGSLTSSLGDSGTATDTMTVSDTAPPPETTQQYQLSVTKTGNGSGTVGSTPSGIDCGQDCSQSFDDGTSVTLTATPDAESTFAGWTGACTGTGGCTVNMTTDTIVTAAFNKTDSDGDGTPDDTDLCPNDPDKTDPGSCGCGISDSDTDNNGIPDCLDTDNDILPDDLDLDGNGTPDKDQGDIRVVPDGTGNTYFGIVAPEGVAITMLEWIDPSTIADTTNRPDQFPLGLVKFVAIGANPGDTVDFTIYCSAPIPQNAVWYKYDPVYGWYDFSEFVVISEDRMSVTLRIEDGGFGDADGLVNGMFEDPSGPGLVIDDGTDDSPPDVTGKGGGSSGCFVKALTTN